MVQPAARKGTTSSIMLNARRTDMYVPAHFEEPRRDVLHDLIKHHPFGMLVTHGASGLDANHIPFELDPQQSEMGVLTAHVARANPVWRNVADGDEVLVVFRVADAYISPKETLNKSLEPVRI